NAIRGELGISDLFPTADGERVMVAVAFRAPDGIRVWYSQTTIAPVTKFAKPILSSALDVTGARGYLVDSKGRLIAASTEDAVGAALPAALASAGNRPATVGADYVVSVAVPGTPWRVVFAAPIAALLAPARSTARVAWALFGAFVLAMLLVLGAGAL